eukprot:4558981-Amphidinium_carterae.1
MPKAKGRIHTYTHTSTPFANSQPTQGRIFAHIAGYSTHASAHPRSDSPPLQHVYIPVAYERPHARRANLHRSFL